MNWATSVLNWNPVSEMQGGGLRRHWPEGSGQDQVFVHVRPPVTEELPRLADLLDLVEVHVPDEELLFVRVPQRSDELAARVAEVALPVEIVVADVGFDADPVDGPNEVAVGHRVADLLDAPEVFAQSARRRARDEHHLRAVEAQGAGALREMAVVADIHADLAHRRLEDGIAQVAGPEVELLPEALDVRDVRLAVLAEVRPVGV